MYIHCIYILRGRAIEGWSIPSLKPVVVNDCVIGTIPVLVVVFISYYFTTPCTIPPLLRAAVTSAIRYLPRNSEYCQGIASANSA